MAGLHSRTHPAGAEAEAERPEARGQCPPHNHISHSALLPCPCVTSGESFPISRAQFPHLYGEANTVTPPGYQHCPLVAPASFTCLSLVASSSLIPPDFSHLLLNFYRPAAGCHPPRIRSPGVFRKCRPGPGSLSPWGGPTLAPPHSLASSGLLPPSHLHAFVTRSRRSQVNMPCLFLRSRPVYKLLPLPQSVL